MPTELQGRRGAGMLSKFRTIVTLLWRWNVRNDARWRLPYRLFNVQEDRLHLLPAVASISTSNGACPTVRPTITPYCTTTTFTAATFAAATVSTAATSLAAATLAAATLKFFQDNFEIFCENYGKTGQWRA